MRWRLPLILLVSTAVAAGCYETRVVRSSWDTFPQDPKNPNEAGPGDTQRSLGYAVKLAEFEGKDRHQQAFDYVTDLREQTQLTDLWVADQGEGSAVLFTGRFRRSSDLDARLALKQAREVRMDGKKPFAGASLVAIAGASNTVGGSPIDPHDLRQFTGYYSLQIGYYDADFPTGRTAAAEEAVRVLRKDGAEAYYYHGPHRSLVCIGLFTDEDFQWIDGVMAYGDRIRALQAQYPHNLGNGRTLIEHRDGQATEQPSFLVRVF